MYSFLQLLNLGIDLAQALVVREVSFCDYGINSGEQFVATRNFLFKRILESLELGSNLVTPSKPANHVIGFKQEFILQSRKHTLGIVFDGHRFDFYNYVRSGLWRT